MNVFEVIVGSAEQFEKGSRAVAVLLDTTPMTPQERGEAMARFLDAWSMLMRFECGRLIERMQTWTASWDVGRLQVLQARGSAMRGIRGTREIAATPTPQIAVCYYTAGVTMGTWGDDEYVCRPGDMLLLDLTEPYVMDWPDGFNSFALLVPHAELGLPAAHARAGH